MTTQSGDVLLEIEGLAVQFETQIAGAEAVREASFTISAGEKLALVGESGSGKTATALAIMRLHDPQAVRYPRGAIRFEGRELLTLDPAGMRALRGRDIAMIFQEPMTALNPVQPIGEQLIEPLLVHQGLGRAAARTRMLELLRHVGFAEPEQRFSAYPHMLSGGQRQRAMIAMALACGPKLLIADEPTTALDVTLQRQILDLLDRLQREFGMAVLFITHDLNLVQRFADRVCVMQDGRTVETGAVAEVFARPRHAYTRQLLDSRPQRLIEPGEGERLAGAPELLRLSDLHCRFALRRGLRRRARGEVRALDGVSLTVRAGETLGVVGESGSGKTTLAHCLLRLQACRGEIRFAGERLDTLSQRRLRPRRREFQVVFQDPYSSLSPRLTVEQIVGEGLQVHFPALDRPARRERVGRALEEVGLGARMMWRYPHEFSGGQRQRIAIARAVVLEPRLLVLDEPTSSLDVSVQKQVLELLRGLQRRHGLSYLFITHDLGVVRAMAHRLVVMRAGRIVEHGETEALFAAPQHDYTRALLQASLLNGSERV